MSLGTFSPATQPVTLGRRMLAAVNWTLFSQVGLTACNMVNPGEFPQAEADPEQEYACMTCVSQWMCMALQGSQGSPGTVTRLSACLTCALAKDRLVP
jgi:hypothetical protein